ncbi:Cysteine dioxygenase type I [Frankia sp. EI5c]|uniref:cysteine dioxygenase n=1 Tax=Frankia sp. EI5c TaxID=683316 RepID=UPI0007C2D1D2|nr:cysteine dioxygenase family protein [Frankia sp. EI5c]OAA28588.1 Cysteine dioxygenase type I [Frankia sp. EI5c]
MPLIHPALFLPAVSAAGADGGSGHQADPLVPSRFLTDERHELSLTDLRGLAGRIAAAADVWRPLVRHDPQRRWYTRLVLSGAVEVWLIGWYPGQQTEVHDHGGALGALAVAEGVVEEDECGTDWVVTRTRRHAAGALAGFGADHVHRVVNRGARCATTVHAYSPPELPLRYAPRPRAQAGSGPLDALRELAPATAAAAAPRPRPRAQAALPSGLPA